MNLTLKQDSVLKLVEGTRRTPYHSLLIVYSPYYLPVNDEALTTQIKMNNRAIQQSSPHRERRQTTNHIERLHVTTNYYSKNYIQYID